MANFLKGFEEFLGRGSKKSLKEVDNFIKRSMKNLTKEAGKFTEEGGLIDKEISSFQSGIRDFFKTGKMEGLDDSVKEFMNNSNIDFDAQYKKFNNYTSSMEDVIKKSTEAKEKLSSVSGKELEELNKQIEGYQSKIESIAEKQKNLVTNTVNSSTKEYSRGAAEDIDEAIKKAMTNENEGYNSSFINEVDARMKYADKRINKSSNIDIPNGMSQRDASLYSAASDTRASIEGKLKNLEELGQFDTDEYKNLLGMKSNADDLLGKIQKKNAYRGLAGPSSDASAFMNKMDGAMRRIVPAAVGGGLIFAMASRGGNMSNNELYGQQQPYAGAQ